MDPVTDPTPSEVYPVSIRTVTSGQTVLTLTWRPPRSTGHALDFIAIADVRRRDDPRVLGWVGYRQHHALPAFVGSHDEPDAAEPNGVYTNDLTAAAAHAAGPSLTSAAAMYALIAARTPSEFAIITGRRVLTPEQVTCLRREWAQWLTEQPDQGAWGTRAGACFHAFIHARAEQAGWDGPTYIAWLLDVAHVGQRPTTLQDLADQGYSVGQPEPGDEEN